MTRFRFTRPGDLADDPTGAQVTCPCEAPDCPGDGGGYYVSLVRDRRTALLLGPYDLHAEALANVRRARGRPPRLRVRRGGVVSWAVPGCGVALLTA